MYAILSGQGLYFISIFNKCFINMCVAVLFYFSGDRCKMLEK